MNLASNSMDPKADQRVAACGSAIMRIGPSFVDEIKLEKSPDPRLTFDRMLKAEDRSHMPSFIDRYLHEMGIGTVLTGEERVPRRELFVHMVRSIEPGSFDTDTWARACLRMGNLVALSIRELATMPLEPGDSSSIINEQSSMAKRLFSRAKAFPELSLIAIGNEALMDHWAGRSTQALSSLEGAISGKMVDESTAELLLKSAIINRDMGRNDISRSILESIPREMLPKRGQDLLSREEGGQ
jgi:hypothetical protein